MHFTFNAYRAVATGSMLLERHSTEKRPLRLCKCRCTCTYDFLPMPANQPSQVVALRQIRNWLVTEPDWFFVVEDAGRHTTAIWDIFPSDRGRLFSYEPAADARIWWG